MRRQDKVVAATPRRPRTAIGPVSQSQAHLHPPAPRAPKVFAATRELSVCVVGKSEENIEIHHRDGHRVDLPVTHRREPAVVLSDDGKRLATVEPGARVRLWDTGTFALLLDQTLRQVVHHVEFQGEILFAITDLGAPRLHPVAECRADHTVAPEPPTLRRAHRACQLDGFRPGDDGRGL